MFRQITSATLVHALLLLSLVASTPSRGEACNIPVFRYALERWNPDTARVMVFYEGSLGDGDEALRIGFEADGIVGEVAGEDGRIEISTRDVPADLANGLRAGLPVARKCDMEPGITIDDVVTCASLDGVAAVATQHDVAA